MFRFAVVFGLICSAVGVPIQSSTNHARVARDLVHKAQWTAFGTISSSFKNYEGFPYVSVVSVADSGKGHIYFMLAPMDSPAKDLKKKNAVTVQFTNEQDLGCSKQGIDPMEPTCARVSISGSAQELTKEAEEYDFAYTSFVSRHPSASKWVQVHRFKLFKLNIQHIVLFNGYGGMHIISPKDYYAAGM